MENKKIGTMLLIKRKLWFVLSFLLVAIIVFYLYSFFAGVNNYLIENKYYSFKLQSPKTWVMREKTIYSEENITKFLAECEKGKAVKEIGAFRVESQRYPETFGDVGYSFVGITSGAILEITVNCNLDNIKEYSSGIKVDEENVYEDIINLPGFGKISQLSFLHNNLQYKIREYIFISPDDSKKEIELRKKYNEIFNDIILSFEFIK